MRLRMLALVALCLPASLATAADPAADPARDMAPTDMAPGDVAIVDFAVADPLTGEPGDALRGRSTFANRKLGNCLACHGNTDLLGEELFHGEVGPVLDGVGSRWSPGELRAIVVNSKAVFGDHTIMPAFYRITGFNRPLDTFEGQTILSAQQVEDLVAYLTTLTE
ncbi:MAG: sulfur oxidation c-type cytochrome SoxX [Pseudomonadota bacterium]